MRSTPGSIAGTTASIQISLNFDINGPDPQRMFTADYLLHIQRDEWADQELIKRSRMEPRQPSPRSIRRSEEDLRRSPDLLYDELPVIPIYHPAMIAAAANKLQGFAIDGKGFYHFETATVSE